MYIRRPLPFAPAKALLYRTNMRSRFFHRTLFQCVPTCSRRLPQPSPSPANRAPKSARPELVEGCAHRPPATPHPRCRFRQRTLFQRVPGTRHNCLPRPLTGHPNPLILSLSKDARRRRRKPPPVAPSSQEPCSSVFQPAPRSRRAAGRSRLAFRRLCAYVRARLRTVSGQLEQGRAFAAPVPIGKARPRWALAAAFGHAGSSATKTGGYNRLAGKT